MSEASKGRDLPYLRVSCSRSECFQITHMTCATAVAIHSLLTMLFKLIGIPKTGKLRTT
jgi:hypothetical protein